MESQQFCLKWKNHQGNLVSVFSDLLQSEAFVDVTLACEGIMIKAHKLVLSACSPFFEEIFKNNPCKHPVIILRDMKFSDLKDIVTFMYKGEVSISQDKLASLLKTAESLRIKGLTDMDNANKASNYQEPLFKDHSNSAKNGKRKKDSDDVEEIIYKDPNIQTTAKSSRTSFKDFNAMKQQSRIAQNSPGPSQTTIHKNRSHQSPFKSTSVALQNAPSTGSSLHDSAQNSPFTDHDFNIDSGPEQHLDMETNINNEEYILEPTSVEVQNLNEPTFMKEETNIDSPLRFESMQDFSGCDDSASQVLESTPVSERFKNEDICEEIGAEGSPPERLDQSEDGTGNSSHIHDGEHKKRTCPYCLKRIHTASYKRHIDTIHLGYKKVCDICQRAFSQTSSLLSHKRQIHNLF